MQNVSTQDSSTDAQSIQDQFIQDLQAWKDAEDQYSLSESTFKSFLEQLATVLESQDPNAIQIMFMELSSNVLNPMLNMKGDNIGILSASMQLSSDLKAFTNQLQNDFYSNAQTANPESMTDFLTAYNYLQQDITTLEEPYNGGSSPLDPSTAGNIASNLSEIKTQFGTDWGNAAAMATDINTWLSSTATTPSDNPIPGGNINPPIPNDPYNQVKTITGDFQQVNSNVSTYSTTTQTSMQFFVNEYNQCMGIDNSTQQSLMTGIAAMVNNQKTN